MIFIDSYIVHLVTAISSGIIGVCGVIVPFLSEHLRSRREERAKRIDFYLNTQNDLYRDFVTSYGKLSAECTYEHLALFLSASNNLLLLADDSAFREIQSLTEMISYNAGEVTPESDVLFAQCIKSLRKQYRGLFALSHAQIPNHHSNRDK